MNIIQFAFVDPTMIGATLALKYAKHFAQEIEGGVEKIILRDVKDDIAADTPLLSEWVSARDFLDRLCLAVNAHLGAGGLDLGRITIESLDPGAAVQWCAEQGEYSDNHLRFVVGLLPCAGAWTYCNGEAALLGAGNVAYLNHRALHSEVNLGAVPRVRMVVDFRKPTTQ